MIDANDPDEIPHGQIIKIDNNKVIQIFYDISPSGYPRPRMRILSKKNRKKKRKYISDNIYS